MWNWSSESIAKLDLRQLKIRIPKNHIVAQGVISINQDGKAW